MPPGQKSLFRQKWFWIPLIAILILGICCSYYFLGSKTEEYEYFTATVERGPVRNAVSATGVVQAVLTVQVGSQVSGQIQTLYADYNTMVKRGQLLAKIDPRNFDTQVQNAQASLTAAEARVRMVDADTFNQQANLVSAQANLEAARVARDNAELVHKRYQELSQSGVLSQNDLDTAKANADGAVAKYNQTAAAIDQVKAQILSTKAQLEQAKAQVLQARAELDRAKVNLDYTDIYSPVDGVVIQRAVDVGQTVAASLQAPVLFVIANDLTKMQVNASIDEADIGKITPAVETTFTVDAYSTDIFRGQIAEVRLDPQTVQNVVTYSVIINVDNPRLKLKPGMTANITMTVEQREQALKVPNAALRYLPPGMTRENAVALMKKSREGTAAAAGEPAGGERITDSSLPAEGAGMPGNRTGSSEGPASRADATPSATPGPRAARHWAGTEGGGFRPASAGKTPSASTPLAPGQVWNIAEKIQFPAPRQRPARPAMVWVLDASGKPQFRRILTGITDGASTEVVGGDVKENDKVITGDTSQEQATNGTGTTTRSPLTPGFGGPPGRH